MNNITGTAHINEENVMCFQSDAKKGCALDEKKVNAKHSREQ